MQISNDLLMAVFAGMGRTNEEEVYFDRENMDVVSFVSGYFSSLLGDQTESNRRLANRIIAGDTRDYVDETRHILIDRLILSQFLDEYRRQADGEEPFYSFPEIFEKAVLNDFSYEEDLTTDDLTFTNHIQQKFHQVFSEHYGSRAQELRVKYSSIFENTCNRIALKWANSKISNQQNKIQPMEFNLAEKLAIVKAINEVILADGDIAPGEMVYLQQLMEVLNFDFDFVEQARRFNNAQAVAILQAMSEPKKHALAIMLHEMADADGEIDETEMAVVVAVFMAAGIKIGDKPQPPETFDVSDIYFESSDHIRYENGVHKSGPHSGAARAVKVEPHIEGKAGYSVTVYNLDGAHPLWGNNIQMAPKQMKVISTNENKTVLRGYGADPRAMGDPAGKFSNYGISIHHPGNEIEKIVLHMHDRGVDIEYLQ